MWLLRKDDGRYLCPCCRGEFVSASLLSELADADNVNVDVDAVGRGVNEDGTAMEEGGVGGNNEDGATASTTAAGPRADPRPPPPAQIGVAWQVRPGVALQLRPSAQQIRWQLAQQQSQEQQQPV